MFRDVIPQPFELSKAGDQTAIAGEDGQVDNTSWDISVLPIMPPLDFTGNVSMQVVTTIMFDNGASLSTSTDLSFCGE